VPTRGRDDDDLPVPPIRLAVVADALLVEMGGVPRSVLGVTSELATLDPDELNVTVVAARRPASINGLPFKRSRAPRVPSLPNALFALQRPFALRDFDLVHYMDSRPPLDFALGRVPTVITQHGFAALMFGDDYVSKKDRLVNSALLKIAPGADLTLTASESERSELLARSPIDPDRVIAIHHGVDHDRFKPPADREDARAIVRAAFGVERPYLLYVSNHQRKKNTERLVQAFAQLAAELPDVALVMTGRHGSTFPLVLELIERHGLDDRVHILGHVEDEALPHLYGGAAAFTLPSLHEGFGLPALEAMACGTPVVAANVYALPEVCGDAAELVDPYDVDDIARGLVRVLGDEARAAELVARGLERAAEFTWRRSAERHLESYKRLLSGR
jgi:glycosyltransferase involved in cell wall biosynthesis